MLHLELVLIVGSCSSPDGIVIDVEPESPILAGMHQTVAKNSGGVLHDGQGAVMVTKDDVADLPCAGNQFQGLPGVRKAQVLNRAAGLAVEDQAALVIATCGRAGAAADDRADVITIL